MILLSLQVKATLVARTHAYPHGSLELHRGPGAHAASALRGPAALPRRDHRLARGDETLRRPAVEP